MSQLQPSDDRAEARKARKEQKKKDALRNEFIRKLMSDPEGRRWIWDTLLECNVFSTSFTDDPYRTAFACGQQNVGLRLMAQVTQAAPELYLEMQLEQANDDRLRQHFSGSSDDDGDDADD